MPLLDHRALFVAPLGLERRVGSVKLCSTGIKRITTLATNGPWPTATLQHSQAYF